MSIRIPPPPIPFQTMIDRSWNAVRAARLRKRPQLEGPPQIRTNRMGTFHLSSPRPEMPCLGRLLASHL